MPASIEDLKTLKFTTRPKLKGDNQDLNHVNVIPEECDIVYKMNTYKYGISSSQLWESLSRGTINLLVLSDPNCIEKLIELFGSICTVIYLHANNNLDKIKDQMKPNGFKKDEIKERIEIMKKLFKLLRRS